VRADNIALMETNGKRKRNAPEGVQPAGVKRSKVLFVAGLVSQSHPKVQLAHLCLQGGNQGKWMTPSHKAKLAAIKGRSLEVGDAGFWVTCQRQKEMRAADEILSICDDVCKSLFLRHMHWDDLKLTIPGP